MAGPEFINLIERGVILGDDKNLILMLLSGNADEPVAEKREVGLADGADDDGAVPVPGHERRRLGQRVVAPLGDGGLDGGEDAVRHAGPREEDAEEDEEREEEQKRRGAEEREGSLRRRGGARGEWVRVRERVVDGSLVQERRHCSLIERKRSSGIES